MNNKHKRILLFLFLCIGARALITYIVAKHEKIYRLALTIFLLIPAVGFGYIYANDLRKTGAEVFGDKIWWNYMRPFHSLMYFLSAYLVNLGHGNAFYPLVLDTIAGLRAFIQYHTSLL